MEYFETKAKFTKDQGDGKAPQSTSELYIARALSYADVEERITEIVEHMSFEGLPELSIRKVKYTDIFPCDNPNADKWYKVKVIFRMLDGEGDNLKEKLVAQLFLVQAWDIASALKHTETNLRGGMTDGYVHTVSETKILDYYDFSVADVREEQV